MEWEWKCRGAGMEICGNGGIVDLKIIVAEDCVVNWIR
jgi:hypothetical protein